MAPSRRKGGRKAAAAAARQQWKVGDLVLAKVKGFPAWPAMVSEPEKWGYSESSDWKKVLVYFFGTEQIAFCNPADVEAFTEEKKQSLLNRQGRGADFVRAVQEIVDSYEKLKRDAQFHEANSGGEVANANSAKDQINSCAKNQTDGPELTPNLPKKSSNSATNNHELVCALEDDSTAPLKDEFHEKEASFEKTTHYTAMVKSPKPVTYSSRKRTAGNLCQPGAVVHNHVSARRSRSLSRVQNSGVPCSDGGKSAGNLSANADHSAYIRRKKRTRKSPDIFGCDDFGSSSPVSNGCMEDNGSEILTTDSDRFSLNEGSTIDSKSGPDHSGTIESPKEAELNKGLDIEIKAVVNKKKRNPNRKRATDDAAKPAGRLEERAGSMHNTSPSSQNVCVNSKEKCLEQDGDEHLPLLKRARVRMGELSSGEEELNSNCEVQQKNCKEYINSPQEMITSSNCENGSPADGVSSVLKGSLVHVSPSKVLVSCSDTNIYSPKKHQTLCPVDDEAALPPSKRLHRALEAMSANAAEEGQSHTEASSSIITSNVTCCISVVKRCPCVASNNQEDNGLGPQGLDTCGIHSSQTSVHGFSAHTNPMISTEKKSSVRVDELLTKFQPHETRKDVLSGDSDHVGEDFNDNAVNAVSQSTETESKSQLHEENSPNLDSKCCEVGSNQDSSDPSLPLNDEDNVRTVNHSNSASDASAHDVISHDPLAGVNENSITLPCSNVEVPENEVAICGNEECLMPAVGDCSKSNDMSEAVKEIKCKGPEEDMNSVSTSDDCLREKGTLGIRSSTSLTVGGDCIPPGSPPNTSVCNVSTSDSSNILHNGSCSPDVNLHQKQTLSGHDVGKDRFAATQQSSSVGKSTEAGHAALLYFEAMLGTLTRTKESIGRATRIAIDCAKFGIADKVIEILAHNLETESSMHRRVNLFFLVDSIAQFSRGLKGEVCGVYPSAIQAVLPRLLSAAAPSGNTAQENRRQCFKVLRVWSERRILPESIIRHHIRQLHSYITAASAGPFSRRTMRNERALDDPVRDMEGMLVDEYGSNSSFQLPGLCMPQMLKDKDEDDGSDSDGGNFEAVTPEHNSEVHDSTIEKHRHILEDVDGELEMEDVAPSRDVEMNSFGNADGMNATQFEKNPPLSFAPPPHREPPSSPPPLSSHPPPTLPPPPPLPPGLPPPMLHHTSSTSDPYRTVVQAPKDNPLHSAAQPMAAPRCSQLSDALQCQVSEYREVPMSEPTCSLNSFPIPPPDNFRHSDSMHNNGYPMRPPHHVPSNQFSFVHGGLHVDHQREFLPPPSSYSNRHHFGHNMERENFYNNHERLKPPPYDYRERWDAPYTGPRYNDKDAPPPYGCHPCESTRIPDHEWRFPPRSMNHRNSMPFRPPFEDAIPVAHRGPGFWRPR